MGARRLLGWLAPALLCGVAILQLAALAQTSLSPWKLGGFGMYSGTDSLGARWLRAVLVTGAGELPVSFDRILEDRPELAGQARAARSLPDADVLGVLGDELLRGPKRFFDCTPGRLARVGGRDGDDERRRVMAHFVRLRLPSRARGSGCRPLVVAGLRLEVWRYRYESDQRRLVAEKVSEAGAVAPR